MKNQLTIILLTLFIATLLAATWHGYEIFIQKHPGGISNTKERIEKCKLGLKSNMSDDHREKYKEFTHIKTTFNNEDKSEVADFFTITNNENSKPRYTGICLSDSASKTPKYFTIYFPLSDIVHFAIQLGELEKKIGELTQELESSRQRMDQLTSGNQKPEFDLAVMEIEKKYPIFNPGSNRYNDKFMNLALARMKNLMGTGLSLPLAARLAAEQTCNAVRTSGGTCN